MKSNWSILIFGISSLLLVGCDQSQYVHVGENWKAVHELEPPKDTFRVRVTSGSKYKIGDKFHFSVTSDKSGHLWVVQVDSNDDVTVLYPNEHAEDNYIKARQAVRIPPRDAAWSLEAGEPAGPSVVAFIITTGDVELDDILDRDKSMTKAMRVVAASDTWAVKKQVIDIKEDK